MNSIEKDNKPSLLIKLFELGFKDTAYFLWNSYIATDDTDKETYEMMRHFHDDIHRNS